MNKLRKVGQNAFDAAFTGEEGENSGVNVDPNLFAILCSKETFFSSFLVARKILIIICFYCGNKVCDVTLQK